MKTKSQKSPRALFGKRRGFTLIEVIATLVLSSIMLAMSLPLIGAALEGSRDAVIRMPETHTLRTKMDTFWQLHRTDYPTEEDLQVLYVVIIIDSIFDNSYDLDFIGFTHFHDDGDEHVKTDGEAMRVTLSNSQGERLTAYFTEVP